PTHNEGRVRLKSSSQQRHLRFGRSSSQGHRRVRKVAQVSRSSFPSKRPEQHSRRVLRVVRPASDKGEIVFHASFTHFERPTRSPAPRSCSRPCGKRRRKTACAGKGQSRESSGSRRRLCRQRNLYHLPRGPGPPLQEHPYGQGDGPSANAG